MAEENKNTETLENTGGQENNTAENSAEEKKYSETDMNNISKRNSEKAVNKLMKELGITDKEKAKAILAKAASEEAAAAEKGNASSENQLSELNTQLAQAQERADNAVLENLLLMSKVKAEKVARAARLIERKDCIDEDGAFSREKAEEAVKKLLEEWPELAEKEETGKVGFQIGGDGESKGGKPAAKEKNPVQKSWNKFNY